MKLSLAPWRRSAGILLMQCLVYIGVFAILTTVGMGAFYVCWQHTRATNNAADVVGAALRAGERWRADLRGATGKVTMESSAAGEQVRIPGRDGAIVYQFSAGEMRRIVATHPGSQLLLSRVKASSMSPEDRQGVTAWRWELELSQRPPEAHLPLLFTFETVEPHP